MDGVGEGEKMGAHRDATARRWANLLRIVQRRILHVTLPAAFYYIPEQTFRNCEKKGCCKSCVPWDSS